MGKYRFSRKSLENLSTCAKPLQILFKKCIEVTDIDFTVICGHRDKKSQDEAYRLGHSQLRWPRSNHNKFPSLATDIAPYPIDWKDLDRFDELSKIIKSVWEEMTEEERGGFDLSWGGDWKKFLDRPHWELVKSKSSKI